MDMVHRIFCSMEQIQKVHYVSSFDVDKNNGTTNNFQLSINFDGVPISLNTI